MTEPKAAMPNEFAAFVRTTGIRALDHLATRFTEKNEPAADESEEPQPRGAIGRIVRQWSVMTDDEKNRFFDQVIVAVQTVAIAAPVAAAVKKVRKSKAAAKAKPAAATSAKKAHDGGTKADKKDKKKKDKKDKKGKKKDKKRDKKGKKK